MSSTWLWYEKKPYRIELDQKSEILGLKEDKDWVLLANYRAPTFLMNAFAFELADWMGIVFGLGYPHKPRLDGSFLPTNVFGCHVEGFENQLIRQWAVHACPPAPTLTSGQVGAEHVHHSRCFRSPGG